MDTQIVVALIGAAGTIVAALIGIQFWRRREGGTPPVAPGKLEFVDVSIDPSSTDWYEQAPDAPQHRAVPIVWKSAQWRIAKSNFDEKADLPLRATLRNGGDAATVVTRIGVEVVAAQNAWYTGIYYGDAPTAREIDVIGAYELTLGSAPDVAAGLRKVMQRDPDIDGWEELGVRCELTLPKAVEVDARGPLVFTLNLKQFDTDMPTHSVLRLWLRTDGGEVRSGDILVSFGR